MDVTPAEMGDFMGHYVPWRATRIREIVRHFGQDWFPGKRILELGCGYGHLGMFLSCLGADVTFSDGRQNHLDEIKDVPRDRIILANIENEWPFEGHWDLILHQGLLYHLMDMSFGLEKAFECCDHMALESETLDSKNVDATKVQNEPGVVHSALDHQSLRRTPTHIENELLRIGFRFDRCLDPRLNSGEHIYDWTPKCDNISFAGKRRWWWCWRADNGAS